MPRKTIDIEFVKNEANKQLRRTDKHATVEFKEGVIAMLECILHKTENYKGFAFLGNPEDAKIYIDDEGAYRANLGHVSRRYY